MFINIIISKPGTLRFPNLQTLFLFVVHYIRQIVGPLSKTSRKRERENIKGKGKCNRRATRQSETTML